MTRLRALVGACTVLLSLSVSAAELTRITSSFEPKNPFGLALQVGYERTQHRAKLVREAHQEGEVKDVSELRYTGVDSRLKLDLRLGLYQDLEFHYGVPVIFAQDRTWGFAGGTDTKNSTIVNNCLQANGQLLDENCPGAGERPLFAVPAESFRGGLGNMTFGLAYAIFNQAKDDTKPTWILGLDYEAPTAEMLDPTAPTAEDARGRLGDRNHHYKFYSSFSRRISSVEPYFQLHYTVPVRGPGWYSNCDHPDPSTMGYPENCNTSDWTRSETGVRIPHVGGFIFGSEFNAYDDANLGQKVAFDVRGIANYVSEGRYYNELSDLLGKYLQTQEYLQVGGQLSFVAQPAEYVILNVSAQVLYNTEHTLTDESVGKDLTNNGTVDLTVEPREINPNFDFRTDMNARRFRSVENSVFVLSANATFAF